MSALAQGYVTAIPHEKEGILGMLRRFELPANAQTVQQFRALNGLTATAGVVVDKTYKMPIRRYRYNGTSIRSTVGITDYTRAQRIADYNSRMMNNGIREDDFLVSRDLWVPVQDWKGLKPLASERAVDLARIPATITSTTGTFPIFGTTYAKVKRTDKALGGRVYILDAGHGGPDPGAIASNDGDFTLYEDEYAYDITLRLARNLLRRGATVYLTVYDPDDGIREGIRLMPDKHEVFIGNQAMVTNFADRLRQRSGVVNLLADLHPNATCRLISIHVDSREMKDFPEPMDPHFSYYSTSTEGETLAQTLLDTMRPHYLAAKGTYNGRTQTRDQLHMLLYSKIPTVLVETANLKNPTDQARMTKASYRQNLADWLMEGLIREAKR